MEQIGKIVKCLEPRSGQSMRGMWTSQDFVLEVTRNSDYKTYMVFTVFGQDRLQRFGIKEGMNVNVSFVIDAHEYEGRWYNSIRAFDVREREIIDATPAQERNPFDEI